MNKHMILINTGILLLFPIVLIIYFISDGQTLLDEVLLLAVPFIIFAILFTLRISVYKPIAVLCAELSIGNQKTIGFKGVQDEVRRLKRLIVSATTIVDQLKSGDLSCPEVSEDVSHEELLKRLGELRAELSAVRKLEEQRKWVGESMNKFVDLLKADYADEKSFYDCLISNIVRCVDANQGGLFILNEGEDKHLALASCYAYNRQKHTEKRIELGQGMVGQAYLEGTTIVLRQIPDKYVSITSGLGYATPKCLLIVPCKINDDVECLVELASFNDFEKYQVEFLEKVGQSIASAVSARNANAKTKALLSETQQITEELRAQEEEMRQNMEELTATQEEMVRKEKELERLLEQSNLQQEQLKNTISEIERLKEKNQRDSAHSLALQEKFKADIIEILNQIPAKIFLKDNNGVMILCNKTVADGYNVSIEELIGTHDRDHFDHDQVVEWEKQEKEIMKKGKKTFLQEERLHDRTRYLQTTKVPFFIKHLNQQGIMGFQLDVSDSINAEKIQRELLDEIAQLKVR